MLLTILDKVATKQPAKKVEEEEDEEDLLRKLQEEMAA